MASSNDITGARLISKPPSEEYQNGYERIFGKKENKVDNTSPSPHWVLGEPAASPKEDKDN